ncbi:transglutaminase domain-containing protein [Frankia sp. CNm7]|uniref:Transglutaminase domain-containing protein n=1 Tax=Frankia nepalensis TaxID=1836974 RepID=A0A937RIC0_9ACTN|nr:transglutaminaseTgpA domain-containing protein [Frankia nepalensis]MBL7500546.1 transglutaminase domain-containing protein [Frankia nepalensis]MBL7509760.1 transglutaminase domain-containing protein [Frankia nepalensis]MBL7523264.1 transglutaminase domain-containing protein [Frankia nepalensis]MBL7627879.1 transglutaminase domain-containing protein [Frankia nepalensis]
MKTTRTPPGGDTGAARRRGDGAPGRWPTGTQAFCQAVVAASVGVCVVVSFWPAVDGQGLIVAVGVCSAAPAALAAVCHRLRWGVGPAALVSLLGFALTGLGLLIGRAGVGGGVVDELSAVPSGVTDGGTRLLEYLPPAPDHTYVLILPALLAWLAAWTGAELALRTGRGPLPALPSLSAWVLALALSTPGDDRHLLSGAAVVGAVALLAVARREPGARPAGAAGADSGWHGVRASSAAGDATAAGTSARRAARGLSRLPSFVVGRALPLVVVAAVTAVALTAGGAARDPLGDAHDIRDRVRPRPLDLNFDVLGAYDQWRAAPDSRLFTADPSGGRWWRLATLDSFDGVRWAPAGSFRRMGRHVDPPGLAPRRDTTVRVAVDLIDLGGVFLPTLDQATEIRGLEVWMDPDVGLLVRDDAEPGPGGGYTVTAKVARPLGTTAAPVHPAGGDPKRADTGYIPPGCARAAASLVSAAGATFAGRGDADSVREWALGLSDRIAALLSPVPDAPAAPAPATAAPAAATPAVAVPTPATAAAGGRYGCAALTAVALDGATASQGQAVAAFVLAARAAGLPARIAVGFTPTGDRDEDEGARAGGRDTVTGRDARLWAEIYVSGTGWLPFFVGTSERSEITTNEAAGGRLPEEPPLTGGGGPAPGRLPTATPPVRVEDPAVGAALSVSRDVLSVLVPLFLLVLLAMFLIVMWRVLRRRAQARQAARERERAAVAPSPADRVLAGWYGSLDALAAVEPSAVDAPSTAADAVRRAESVLPPAAGELHALRVAAGQILYAGLTDVTAAQALRAEQYRSHFATAARQAATPSAARDPTQH